MSTYKTHLKPTLKHSLFPFPCQSIIFELIKPAIVSAVSVEVFYMPVERTLWRPYDGNGLRASNIHNRHNCTLTCFNIRLVVSTDVH